MLSPSPKRYSRADFERAAKHVTQEFKGAVVAEAFRIAARVTEPNVADVARVAGAIRIQHMMTSEASYRATRAAIAALATEEKG